MKKYVLGAYIGDICGSIYEFSWSDKTTLFEKGCRITDDSIMTAAVWDMYINNELRDKNKIIKTFRKWGCKYPTGRYGMSFFNWLFSPNPQPYNSCGNGAAMRISPIGWIAKNEQEVKEFSYNVTSVTHNHPEGIKGAETIAMCIFYARTGKSKKFLWDYAIGQYPNMEKIFMEYVSNYGKPFEGLTTCQKTVPLSLYCFFKSNSFRECLENALSLGGDSDTNSAIACSVAEAFYKDVPEDIAKRTFKKLPKDILQITKKVYNKINR